MKKLPTYFSKPELTLWGSSAGLILLSFFLFDRIQPFCAAVQLGSFSKTGFSKRLTESGNMKKEEVDSHFLFFHS